MEKVIHTWGDSRGATKNVLHAQKVLNQTQKTYFRVLLFFQIKLASKTSGKRLWLLRITLILSLSCSLSLLFTCDRQKDPRRWAFYSSNFFNLGTKPIASFSSPYGQRLAMVLCYVLQHKNLVPRVNWSQQFNFSGEKQDPGSLSLLGLRQKRPGRNMFGLIAVKTFFSFWS